MSEWVCPACNEISDIIYTISPCNCVICSSCADKRLCALCTRMKLKRKRNSILENTIERSRIQRNVFDLLLTEYAQFYDKMNKSNFTFYMDIEKSNGRELGINPNMKAETRFNTLFGSEVIAGSPPFNINVIAKNATTRVSWTIPSYMFDNPKQYNLDDRIIGMVKNYDSNTIDEFEKLKINEKHFYRDYAKLIGKKLL